LLEKLSNVVLTQLTLNYISILKKTKNPFHLILQLIKIKIITLASTVLTKMKKLLFLTFYLMTT
jgi:hypothetical protein